MLNTWTLQPSEAVLCFHCWLISQLIPTMNAIQQWCVMTSSTALTLAQASLIRMGPFELCYLPICNCCFRVIFGSHFSPRSSRPPPLCRVVASQVSHIFIRLAVGRITGEVIKTGIALLLSLSLNMSHSATLNMRMCRHIILGSESLCLLLDALALSFLAGTIEMQT